MLAIVCAQPKNVDVLLKSGADIYKKNVAVRVCV